MRGEGRGDSERVCERMGPLVGETGLGMEDWCELLPQARSERNTSNARLVCPDITKFEFKMFATPTTLRNTVGRKNTKCGKEHKFMM